MQVVGRCVVTVLVVAAAILSARPAAARVSVALFGAVGEETAKLDSRLCWFRYRSDPTGSNATESALQDTYAGLTSFWRNAQDFDTVDPTCTAPAFAVDARHGRMWVVAFDTSTPVPLAQLRPLRVDEWVRRLRFNGDRLDYFADRLVSTNPESEYVPACSTTGCGHYHHALLAEYENLMTNLYALLASSGGGQALASQGLTTVLVNARRSGTAALGVQGALASWCNTVSLLYSGGNVASDTDWELQCASSSTGPTASIYIAKRQLLFQLPKMCINVHFSPALNSVDLTAGRSPGGAIVVYLDAAQSPTIPNFTATNCARGTSSYDVTSSLSADTVRLKAIPEAPPREQFCLKSEELNHLLLLRQTTRYSPAGDVIQATFRVDPNGPLGAQFELAQLQNIAGFQCSTSEPWTYTGPSYVHSGFTAATCTPKPGQQALDLDALTRGIQIASPVERCQ